MAAADRLGGAALRRGARGHRRGDPAGPQSPASLHAFAGRRRGARRFPPDRAARPTAACGSLVIALALVEGRLDADAAFAASQLDESFQIEAWGEESEQADRRQALAADIAAAAQFLGLLRA